MWAIYCHWYRTWDVGVESPKLRGLSAVYISDDLLKNIGLFQPLFVFFLFLGILKKWHFDRLQLTIVRHDGKHVRIS